MSVKKIALAIVSFNFFGLHELDHGLVGVGYVGEWSLMTGSNALSRWVQSVKWNDFFGWHFLKDPVAICTAVVSSVLIGIFSNIFDINGTLNLVWIVTTILLVMTFGSAEKILVQAVFRMVGTVIGVGIGALLAFGHGQMQKNGASAVALYAYQIALQVLIVFVIAAGTKLFPALYDILVIIALTTAILLFSPDLYFTKSRTLSVLLGVGAAFVCTLLFHYTVAEEVLFLEHRSAATNLMLLAEFAVSSEHRAKHEFEQSSQNIRSSLASASAAWTAYAQWRKLTCRKIPYDFEKLSEALRPLHYEVFSLYWSHAATGLRPRDASTLYCDTAADYETLFRPLIRNIIHGIRLFRHCMEIVLQPTSVSVAERRGALVRLIAIVESRFFLNLELFYVRYADNRLVCFSNRQQRWNMCDYMITLACVLMELIEYVKCVTQLFSNEDIDQYRDLLVRLSHLKDRLNELRYEAHSVELADVVPLMAPIGIVEHGVSNPDHSRSEPVVFSETI